jgi:microcystin-dependent protein
MIPSGLIAAWAASASPPGWLVCDGSAVSRATYSALFAAIGTTWGSGDGSTTFNLPDLRDRVPIGSSPGGLAGSRPSVRAVGQTGGEETHQLTFSELPTSGLNIAGASFCDVNPGFSNSPCGGDGNGGGGALSAWQLNGGNLAHQNMQPWACVQWIIKT